MSRFKYNNNDEKGEKTVNFRKRAHACCACTRNIHVRVVVYAHYEKATAATADERRNHKSRDSGRISGRHRRPASKNRSRRFLRLMRDPKVLMRLWLHSFPLGGITINATETPVYTLADCRRGRVPIAAGTLPVFISFYPVRPARNSKTYSTTRSSVNIPFGRHSAHMSTWRDTFDRIGLFKRFIRTIFVCINNRLINNCRRWSIELMN